MSSSIGILNRTHDNLEKRVARIESQLGRPRSCKYGPTTERIAYGAPEEGVLWWDTTEKALYVWYNSLWMLAKGVMVGETTEREATSMPAAGGMWWDTDEENLYVWGVSNSWQTVTGAKFGTREQRDAGGFPGCIWMCTDEEYAYVYHPDGHWVGVGDSITNFYPVICGGEITVFGHRTALTYSVYEEPDRTYDIYSVGGGQYMRAGRGGTGIYTPALVTLKYGQDGLVPYVDFSDTIAGGDNKAENGGLSYTASSLNNESEHYTIMLWFYLYNFKGQYYIDVTEQTWDWIPQPLIGYWLWREGFCPGGWILWIMDKSLYWGPHRTFYDHPHPPYPPPPGCWVVDNPAVVHGIQLNTWHLAIVRDGYVRLDDGDWSEYSQQPRNLYTTVNGMVGFCNDGTWDWTNTGRTLDGRVSMYYMNDGESLTDAQISFYYERTRRLHGV